MSGSFVLAIDQGTSSTKTVLFDEFGRVVARGHEPLTTSYLPGGRVEQDPEGIYQNVLASVASCLGDFKSKGGNLAAIKSCGISNQRETFVLWDQSGQPLHPAVVWQCKRSSEVCERLKSEGLENEVRTKTGLLIDPYFSGTKAVWLNENNEAVRNAIASGTAYFGTVDTWLLYKLTGGKQYLTDHTNASRTLFFNLKTLEWDQELLSAFGLEGLNLPEISTSSSLYGSSDFEGLFDFSLPITAMIGDSHAAAFGEGCFAPGTAKATMGTGSSILMNIGAKPQSSGHGMVTTVCWSVPGRVDYALEGVIVTCGATIEWLRNGLGLFEDVKTTSQIASGLADNAGVYLVPAFSGLGAPHWDMTRKAFITGLTFDHTKAHLVRAALESIGYQIYDVIKAMESDTSLLMSELMIDGGISGNQFVVQFLSNLLQQPVANPGLPELSALGAAYLSGLQSGVFESIEELSIMQGEKVVVIPDRDGNAMKAAYEGWLTAVHG